MAEPALGLGHGRTVGNRSEDQASVVKSGRLQEIPTLVEGRTTGSLQGPLVGRREREGTLGESGVTCKDLKTPECRLRDVL